MAVAGQLGWPSPALVATSRRGGDCGYPRDIMATALRSRSQISWAIITLTGRTSTVPSRCCAPRSPLGHFEFVVLEKDLTRRVQTPAGGHCHRRNIPWAQNYEFRRPVPTSSPSCSGGRLGPGNTTRSLVTLKASGRSAASGPAEQAARRQPKRTRSARKSRPDLRPSSTYP